MKRYFVALAILLAACAGPEIEMSFDSDGAFVSDREKSQFYELKIDEKSYYFKYPADAVIVGSEDGGYLDYGNCTVYFRLAVKDFQSDPSLENHSKHFRGLTYEAWYKDDLPVTYSVIVDELNYRFWAKDSISGLHNCMDLIDELGESLGGELGYRNEKFGFGLVLPSDFNVEYLNDGVVLTKWFTPEPESVAHTEVEDAHLDYKVEIVFLPFENFEHYPNVAEYIAGQYPGYSIEFADYSGFSGYFVDEGSGNEAVRHFFSLSEDTTLIYEAYMRIPSFHYSLHKNFFDELVGKMEIY